MQEKIILAIHGLGGHSAWFNRLQTIIEKSGIKFFAYDLPGFGRNEPLGHVDSFKVWIDFVDQKYRELKAIYPEASITILGHSLGAVICSNLPKIFSGDQLILSVPGFQGAKETFNKDFTNTVMKKIFWDKLIKQRDVFLEMPVSQKAMDTPAMQDPLRVSSVTQTLLLQILLLGKLTPRRLRKLNCPVLMIQISDDKVVDNDTQVKLFRQIPSSDKTLLVYEGADHDWIWYDIVTVIAKDIINWVLR